MLRFYLICRYFFPSMRCLKSKHLLEIATASLRVSTLHEEVIQKRGLRNRRIDDPLRGTAGRSMAKGFSWIGPSKMLLASSKGSMRDGVDCELVFCKRALAIGHFLCQVQQELVECTVSSVSQARLSNEPLIQLGQ